MLLDDNPRFLFLSKEDDSLEESSVRLVEGAEETARSRRCRWKRSPIDDGGCFDIARMRR